MHFHGPRYTWCNKCKKGLICKKLNCVLVSVVSEQLIQDFPRSYNVFEAGGCSDHLRCRIMLDSEEGRARKPFKFAHILAQSAAFTPLVESYWAEFPALFHSTSAIYRFSKKLKGLKLRLRELHKGKLGNVPKQAKEAFDILCKKQRTNLSHPSSDAMAEEKVAFERWSHVADLEESFFKQQSKLHWLEVGDRNNKTFNRAATTRKAKNSVREIQCQNGEILKIGDEKKQEAERFFLEFLSYSPPDFEGATVERLETILDYKCPENDCTKLMRDITDEEVRKVLFAMLSSKSP